MMADNINNAGTQQFNSVQYSIVPSETVTTASFRTVNKAFSQTFKVSCWEKKTSLEKFLIIFAILSVFLVIVVTVILFVTISVRQHICSADREETVNLFSNGISSNLCLTKECILAAGNMLKKMDQSVNPCDNFYDFACGSWTKDTVIPDDLSSVNTMSKLTLELWTKLKVLLENPFSVNESRAIQMAKLMYRSCVNTKLIELQGDNPLKDLIEELGGWPVLNDWQESSFDLTELMAKLRLIGINVLFKMFISPDDKNSKILNIKIDQPDFGLPSQVLFLRKRERKTLKDHYTMFAMDMIHLFGANQTSANQDISRMITFEEKLYSISLPNEARRDREKMYHQFTLFNLSTLLSKEIDWSRFFQLVFLNTTIEGNEAIIVYNPDYLIKLEQLLEKTSSRTVANYLIWRVVLTCVNLLPENFTKLQSLLKLNVMGVGQIRPRWQFCVSNVNLNFGFAVGKLYVTEYFDEDDKHKATEMIENIRSAFLELLNEVSWLDDSTRTFAKEKADAIQMDIGYPEFIRNNTELDEEYNMVQIDELKFFENNINCWRHQTRKTLNVLKITDRRKWFTPPTVVNAFYNVNENRMIFPAGIIQPPFYHKNCPRSINFGGMGMVIGHELTHGFDDKGRQFDKYGNLLQWWTSDVVKKFKDGASCFIDQYSSYYDKEISMKLNGQITQGENIADNGGLKQAFTAYRKLVEKHGYEEPVLPGLNMTNNQLFFLNFAQIWCGKTRPEISKQDFQFASHPPGKLRVIGTISNSMEFAQAYHCSVGSHMNPMKKCSIW